jgi:hypothetical protein
MSQVLVVGAGPAAAELGAGVAKLATQLAQRGGIWVAGALQPAAVLAYLDRLAAAPGAG